MVHGGVVYEASCGSLFIGQNYPVTSALPPVGSSLSNASLSFLFLSFLFCFLGLVFLPRSGHWLRGRAVRWGGINVRFLDIARPGRGESSSLMNSDSRPEFWGSDCDGHWSECNKFFVSWSSVLFRVSAALYIVRFNKLPLPETNDLFPSRFADGLCADSSTVALCGTCMQPPVVRRCLHLQAAGPAENEGHPARAQAGLVSINYTGHGVPV